MRRSNICQITCRNQGVLPFFIFGGTRCLHDARERARGAFDSALITLSSLPSLRLGMIAIVKWPCIGRARGLQWSEDIATERHGQRLFAAGNEFG